MERQRQNRKQKINKKILFVLLFLSSLVTYPVFAESLKNVIIVSIPGNSAHQKFITSFKAELLSRAPNINVIEKSLDNYSPYIKNALMVTLGSRAFHQTKSIEVKKLHTLISHTLYEGLYPNGVKNTYHLAFNQPIKRTLQLQSILFPDRNFVGILLGEQHTNYLSQLSKKVNSFGRKVVFEKVGDDFKGALSRLLSKSDNLLLLPDPSVINRFTINKSFGDK